MSKKGRFYIQIKEIFDNGFALASMQDYVDIMNDLDKQNENKDKQIAELEKQLKDQRHQICEKIRKEFIERSYLACYEKANREDISFVKANNDCLENIKKFLYQIEKGE